MHHLYLSRNSISLTLLPVIPNFFLNLILALLTATILWRVTQDMSLFERCSIDSMHILLSIIVRDG